MKLTPFENEMIDSLIWQIKGYKEGCVTERATNRTLRASLRRINHRVLGHSVDSIKAQSTHNDHAVPVKIIVAMLMEEPELTKERVLSILGEFYVSVTISKHEHISVLKTLGLESDMPKNWDGVDPFARYKTAGIEIVKNEQSN